MINKNFDLVREQFDCYWQYKNKKPLIACYAPKDIQQSMNLETKDAWLDIEYVLKSSRLQMQNTYYGGAAYPALNPNLGPDIMGASTGHCDIEFGETTSWAVPLLKDLDSPLNISLDKECKWYSSILKLTKAVVEDCKGDYVIGITDLHPGMDGLVSLRGAENLCIDLLENPENIKHANEGMKNSFFELYNDLYSITSKKQIGTSNWMGLWHEKKWYVVSCDFSCLISPTDYEEFVAYEIEKEINFFDATMYHLDGVDALRHLDRILKMDKLNGIQWVYGAGQKGARHWLDILKKIQSAGKCIEITASSEDVKHLVQNLNPQGLLIKCYVSSEKEAKELESSI